jgi:AraC-like DNA-binding protein
MEYEKYKKIYRQIVTYLEEQALYLDPEFSSTRMAQDLNINISYLSKAIQLHSGMNFNRLVNSYRINKVKETLSTNLQSYTMQYIYMSSGFKSQSAFNKAFKMQEGITPSEYIKTLPN